MWKYLFFLSRKSTRSVSKRVSGNRPTVVTYCIWIIQYKRCSCHHCNDFFFPHLYRSASGSRKKRRYRCVWNQYVRTLISIVAVTSLFMSVCIKWNAANEIYLCKLCVMVFSFLPINYCLFKGQYNPYGWYMEVVVFFYTLSRTQLHYLLYAVFQIGQPKEQTQRQEQTEKEVRRT